MCFVFLLGTAALGAGEPLFVAVGYGGRRMSSRDGIAWENHARWSDEAADNDDVLFNIAFGKGKFVAVGGGARIGHILVTRDGSEWKELPQQKGRVATVSFGNDRFVAGNSRQFLWSDDGETWTVGAKLDFKGSVHFRRSAFGKGVFVAIGDCDPPGQKRVCFRASTRDGTSVENFAVDTPVARAITFGNGRFVVVGPNGLRESSADGKTWEHQITEEGLDLNSVLFDGKQFVAAGGKTAFTSTDGIVWKKETYRIPCSLLERGDNLYIGASWGGNIWAAPDVAQWKKGAIPPGPSFNAVASGVLEAK